MESTNHLKNASLFGLIATLAVSIPAPMRALPMVRSVPPASFLEYHVDTVPELAFEVHYAPVVQERLAHHFHLSGPAMCAYVRDSLVLRRLTAPLRTRVYCISPRGREYFVVMTLKRGTPVFAVRCTGKPILRLVCGNPLVAALPRAATGAAHQAHAKPTRAAVRPNVIARTGVSKAVSVPPLPTDVAVSSGTQTSVAGEEVIATSSAPSGVVFTASGGGSGVGWLAWLPVIGGLGGLVTHPGGSGGNGGSSLLPLVPQGLTPPTVIRPSQPRAPLPTPEPGPMLVFLVGTGALGAWRWGRRRR